MAAEANLTVGAATEIPVNPDFEYGVLVDTGAVEINGQRVGSAELAALDLGCRRIRLTAVDGAARVLLIGGTPMESDLVMWWNFVGGSHDEIVAARET